MRRSVLAIAVGAFLVAACGASDGTAGSTTTTTTTTTTATEDDVRPSTPTSSPDETLIGAAVADLAARLAVDAADIGLVLHEDVTWRDGALGCPQPGVSYTQALVDGYRIVLSVDETEYHYHGRSGDIPFLCEEPRLPYGGGATE
jgi:hypothetical protein